MGKRRQPKRRSRGPTKPIPAEAKRLARDIERLQNIQGRPLQHPENIETLLRAEHDCKERLWKARNMLGDVANAQRKLESKAARVIRARWPYWNAKGLQWGERQLEMGKLGFENIKNAKRTSFRSLCTRQLRLKYRPAK
jgi:hypothetical protein